MTFSFSFANHPAMAAIPGGALVFAISLSSSCIAANASSFDSMPIGRISPTSAPPGMVLVRGGVFEMGFAQGHADEATEHRVEVGDFYLDRTEVTNAQFAAFVEATRYTTQAEKDGAAWVFLRGYTDFVYLAGANWRLPFGPDHRIAALMEHPVVCVTWEDAAAFATWAGKRLPTEAEWEFAARSGGGQQISADPQAATLAVNRSDVNTGHRRQSAAHNIWQGTWPHDNQMADDHYYTAEVDFGQPNKLGVYNMIGNAWEWCADWYDADYYASSPRLGPEGPAVGTYRVARGGSWFCSPNYCAAYSSHYRGASPPTSSFNNVGFRCAADVTTAPQQDAMREPPE